MATAPDRWDRWSVDALYTELVSDLRSRRGASPADVSEEAHSQLVEAFLADRPGFEVPSYIQQLGEEVEL